jgi:hypothetical protein
MDYTQLIFQGMERFDFVDGRPVYKSQSRTYAEKLKNGLFLDDLCLAEFSVVDPPKQVNYVVLEDKQDNSRETNYSDQLEDTLDDDIMQYSLCIDRRPSNLKKKNALKKDYTKNRNKNRDKHNIRKIGYDAKLEYMQCDPWNDGEHAMDAKDAKDRIIRPYKKSYTLYCIPVYSYNYEFVQLYNSKYDDKDYFSYYDDIVVYKHIRHPIFFIHCDKSLPLTIHFTNTNLMRTGKYNESINAIHPSIRDLYKIYYYSYPSMKSVYEKIKECRDMCPNFMMFYLYKDDYTNYAYEDFHEIENMLKHVRSLKYHNETITSIIVSSSKYHKLKHIYSSKVLNKKEVCHKVYIETYMRLSSMNFTFSGISSVFRNHIPANLSSY